MMTHLNFIGNKNTVSSKEIAALSRKAHSHVMEAIRKMELAWENINQSKFRLVKYTDSKGEKRPMYELSKIESLYIATKFNDEVRVKLIMRWEELEKAAIIKTPQTFAQALRLAAEQAEQIEAQQMQLEESSKLIEEQKPKVVFADAVAGSNNSILIRDFAKMLCDDNFKIGQNRLFAWLRHKRYLMSDNSPYQNYIEQGYFEVIERTIGDTEQTITVKTTKITGRGQTYFTNKIKS